MQIFPKETWATQKWHRIELVVPYFRDLDALKAAELERASGVLRRIAEYIERSPEDVAMEDGVTNLKAALIRNRQASLRICAHVSQGPLMTPAADRFRDWYRGFSPLGKTLLDACHWGMNLVGSDPDFLGPEVFLQESESFDVLESLFSRECVVTHFSQVLGRYGRKGPEGTSFSDVYDASILFTGILQAERFSKFAASLKEALKEFYQRQYFVIVDGEPFFWSPE